MGVVRSAATRWFDRACGLEEINGDGMCPTYLYRWTLFGCRWFKVYLHHFVGDDWSTDLHDHPKRFISIGLRGAYVEYFPWCCEAPGYDSRVFRAPWFRTFPAEHRHRLALMTRDCWTIAIVGPWQRDWGFWSRGHWVPWWDYVRSDRARAARSCS